MRYSECAPTGTFNPSSNCSPDQPFGYEYHNTEAPTETLKIEHLSKQIIFRITAEKKKEENKTANVTVKLQRAPPNMRPVAPRRQQLSLWLNVFLSRRVEDNELFSVCALV